MAGKLEVIPSHVLAKVQWGVVECCRPRFSPAPPASRSFPPTSMPVGNPQQPMYFSDLATVYQQNGQFDDAQRCIDEAIAAIKATKETIYEAEVYRIAGEIALKSPIPDAAEGSSQFQSCARRRAPATSQILGTPRRNEPRAPLA